jgi:hypothetical protein
MSQMQRLVKANFATLHEAMRLIKTDRFFNQGAS